MSPTSQNLRDLVAGAISQRWEEFSKEHPQLADAIDRVQLVESVVQRLLDDPDYQRAVAGADADQISLSQSAGVMQVILGLVAKVI